MPATLTRRPQATAFSIEDLLDRVRRGEVRIPEFQRPLKWTAKDVRDLFDSVYRGYPIGTLLFWKREAPAASVTFGPVRIDAPSTSQAFWVVDGQQRITALTGVLLHPPDGKRDDFRLFFDLETEEVVSSASDATPPQHWLPLRVVLDSELLLEWLNRYPGRAQHLEHTRRAIRFGKSIREYQVPAYVVEAAEEKTLRIIFKRLNTAGNPLIETEVFNALYGGVAGSRPASLRALADDLKALSFGTLDESTLLQLVLAVRGLDFTQSFQSQLREEDDLTETLQATQQALRDTVIFLKRDAGLAHLMLLPEPRSLHLLVRFFYLHPEPSPRSRDLLSRWLWRRAVALTLTDLTVHLPEPQEALSRIQANEDQAIQALLTQVPGPPDKWANVYLASGILDLSTTSGRLGALALLSLEPRHLLSGAQLDIVSLLEAEGESAFRPIVSSPPGEPESALPLIGSVWNLANYLLHPLLPDQGLLEVLLTGRPAPEVLRSHAISEKALNLLRTRSTLDFIFERAEFLSSLTVNFLKTRTRYDESDRPSLGSLIIKDEED